MGDSTTPYCSPTSWLRPKPWWEERIDRRFGTFLVQSAAEIFDDLHVGSWKPNLEVKSNLWQETSSPKGFAEVLLLIVGRLRAEEGREKPSWDWEDSSSQGVHWQQTHQQHHGWPDQPLHSWSSHRHVWAQDLHSGGELTFNIAIEIRPISIQGYLGHQLLWSVGCRVGQRAGQGHWAWAEEFQQGWI